MLTLTVVVLLVYTVEGAHKGRKSSLGGLMKRDVVFFFLRFGGHCTRFEVTFTFQGVLNILRTRLFFQFHNPEWILREYIQSSSMASVPFFFCFFL